MQILKCFNSSGIYYGINIVFWHSFLCSDSLCTTNLTTCCLNSFPGRLKVTCPSNSIWAGEVTEGNSRTALPSWLCIYWSKSWARTWRNEPWCAVATHGIPPFPDHCYIEIPENVIKFDENHSTIFVRISETFLFKSILIVYNEKIGPCSRKKKTQPCKRSAMLQKNNWRGLYLTGWFSEISWLIP